MKPLVILVASVASVGHVNSCAGALSAVLARGHRVIFVLEEAFKGKAAQFGYEETIYKKKPKANKKGENSDKTENPGETLAKSLRANGILGPGTATEKMIGLKSLMKDLKDEFVGDFNEAVKNAILEFEPDLIYYDNGSLLPAIHRSGIPWINNVSMQPIYYENDDELPPGGSGLPTNDKSEWAKFNEIRMPISVCSKELNDYFEELGYERYPNDVRMPKTAILTVIATPEELNYPAIRKKSNWFNLEVFQKPESQQELVPLEKLVPAEFVTNNLGGKWSGKLIYLSMGSMGSVDLDLMRRLVDILSKTNHKYIVSKGHLHEQYCLGTNMWGGRYLPQTKILPHVDLVITHGGNNTVTETFSFGKKMVSLPLFADQFDNAQRLEETGFGARVDAYEFTDKQLLDAVDRMLSNTELDEKLSAAAARIRSNNRHEQLALKIEELMRARVK